jgi:6-hydroxycyclohex-1-ene-1-carbonyl-CoA dehydrogenase
MAVRSEAWVLEKAGEPLVRRAIELRPSEADVVVEVEACGLCHTDLGFADGSVAPRHALPLVLGHEVSGRVTEAGSARFAHWIGRRVLVPAVMSCGDCVFCTSGRGNACPKQKMPGNDIDGGFATHMIAPGASLVSLDAVPEGMRTDALGVVADAVSTAYQATRRAELEAGDVAFVIGAGGVGGFCAQIARATGAHVAVCDVDRGRLDRLKMHGVCVADRDPKDVRKELHGWARDRGVPSLRWRIFECSGTPAGQQLAYSLLASAATIVFVGYTREAVSVRLSNLMAFDATAHGTWGCLQERYPAVLDLVFQGKIEIEPYIERAPMSRINEHLKALAEHRILRRLVLDPRV